MRILAGTSGYSYKEWKGPFYPEKLPAKQMLAFYAKHLPAVEINNTFYRMPKPSVLENWAEQVPADFRFVLKASRRITHFKRLKGTEEETDYLLETAASLGEKLGALLFQLPPNMKKDVDRLRAFLSHLPKEPAKAFEFRHASWFDEEVYSALGRSNAALCLADTEDGEPPLVATADWGYLRLRRNGYNKKTLTSWVYRLQQLDWNRAFVFFKHEDAGTGPLLATEFLNTAL
ncbi:MAG: DUF72 domain-containing protein [Acidobacteriota bacterium]|nr:DUF72 domain-containing protein [Acidobacteriota bacterium]